MSRPRGVVAPRISGVRLDPGLAALLSSQAHQPGRRAISHHPKWRFQAPLSADPRQRGDRARRCCTRHIRAHEGIAYVIESHTRNVAIEAGEIDPNRMFSRVGAEANLKRLNPDWTPEQLQAALGVLDRGREKLVRALLPPPGGLMMALHNNSEGYSVTDEEPISDADFAPRAGQSARLLPVYRPGGFRDSLDFGLQRGASAARPRRKTTARFPAWPPRAASATSTWKWNWATPAARRKCWTGWSGTVALTVAARKRRARARRKGRSRPYMK